MRKRIIEALMIFMLLILIMVGCSDKPPTSTDQNIISKETVQEQQEITENNDKAQQEQQSQVQRDGHYTSKEQVATYVHQYEKLPDNFITKKEATEMGWQSQEGNLWEVAPGKSIGGDRFGNREKLLPDKKGRKWTECDIDYKGGFRQDKRIVFSNDGLIYYTEDHYQSFEELVLP